MNVDWLAGSFLDAANLVAVPGYALFGAQLGLRLATGEGTVHLVIRGQNLLDARPFDAAGFPLPSRTILATVHIERKAAP